MDSEARVSEQTLMASLSSSPLLVAEIRKLREELADAKRYLRLPIFCDGTSFTAFEEEEIKLIHQKFRIMVEKRQMRGTSNIQRQGLLGVINRLSEDKLERVKRMVADDALAKALNDRDLRATHLGTSLPAAIVSLETAEQKLQLEDDLMDISNYCDIAILLLRDKWE